MVSLATIKSTRCSCGGDIKGSKRRRPSESLTWKLSVAWGFCKLEEESGKLPSCNIYQVCYHGGTAFCNVIQHITRPERKVPSSGLLCQQPTRKNKISSLFEFKFLALCNIDQTGHSSALHFLGSQLPSAPEWFTWGNTGPRIAI